MSDADRRDHRDVVLAEMGKHVDVDALDLAHEADVLDRNGLAVLDRDEHLRPAPRSRRWPALPPSFAAHRASPAGSTPWRCRSYHWVERIEHVHHAGNSSGIVDGAALVLIGSEQAGEATG